MARSRQLLHYLLRTADGTDSRLQAEVQVWIEIRVRYVKQARPTNARQELAPYFFTLGGLMADQRQQKLLLQGGTPGQFSLGRASSLIRRPSQTSFVQPIAALRGPRRAQRFTIAATLRTIARVPMIRAATHFEQ